MSPGGPQLPGPSHRVPRSEFSGGSYCFLQSRAEPRGSWGKEMSSDFRGSGSSPCTPPWGPQLGLRMAAVSPRLPRVGRRAGRLLLIYHRQERALGHS